MAFDAASGAAQHTLAPATAPRRGRRDGTLAACAPPCRRTCSG